MEAFELKATLRTTTGKGPARQSRMHGQVPAVLYGPDTENLALDVEAREVAKLLRRASGANTLVNLSIEGKESRRVLIREYQIHPVKRTLVHVDFYDVTSDNKVVVKVPMRFLGKSEFEKQGGSRQVVLRELRVRCAPDRIPDALTVDMDSLTAMRVRISEVPVPEGVEIVYRIDQPVVQLKTLSDEPEAGAAPAAAAAEPAAAEKTEKAEKPEKKE